MWGDLLPGQREHLRWSGILSSAPNASGGLVGESKEHSTHVLIELDTKVKAEFVKLFGRYAARSAKVPPCPCRRG